MQMNETAYYTEFFLETLQVRRFLSRFTPSWPAHRSQLWAGQPDFLPMGENVIRYRVKNWKKFQHFKDRSPPWIKLYRDILEDYDINMISSDAFRGLIKIWLIASEDKAQKGNLPPLPELSFRLRMNENECLDLLRQLDIFVISEEYQKYLPEEEEEEEKEKEKEAEVEEAPAVKNLTEKEFLKMLRDDPKYSHVNFDTEFVKMDDWLAKHPKGKKTREFVVDWFNRIEKPLGKSPMPNTHNRNPILDQPPMSDEERAAALIAAKEGVKKLEKKYKLKGIP